MENEKKETRPLAEICQRCGERNPDLRTLRMNCFYAMENTGLPFKQQVYFSTDIEKLVKAQEAVAFTTDTGMKINLGPSTVRTEAELTPLAFYTLKVCKGCRGDWLKAQSAWFNADIRYDSCGSGIFVRRGGRNVEISEEEWNQENPGREPVRLHKQED